METGWKGPVEVVLHPAGRVRVVRRASARRRKEWYEARISAPNLSWAPRVAQSYASQDTAFGRTLPSGDAYEVYDDLPAGRVEFVHRWRDGERAQKVRVVAGETAVCVFD